MDGRRLGRTGLIVPPVGLGTVKIGRNRDVKYPEAFDLPDDEDVAALLDAALDEGVVLWDTAPAYGRSEERLGAFVASRRERIVLCTKAGEEYGPGGSTHDFSADAIVASTERSLRRLRTDHIDVLLLHSDGRDRQILDETDALEGLARVRDRGWVRAVGLSAKTADGIDRACDDLDVVMAPCGAGAVETRAALERARDRGMGVLGIKVFGQGHAVDGPEAVESALAAALVDGPAHCAVVGTLKATHLRAAAGAARRILARTRSEDA